MCIRDRKSNKFLTQIQPKRLQTTVERMLDSRLAKQVWKYKPIGHRCVCVCVQEEMTGGSVKAEQAAPCCEDDELYSK